MPRSAQLRQRFPLRRVLLTRFRKNEDGATAVEFGLVATPFFLLIFGIVELALMFWTTQVLENSVFETSRSLLTGQSHTRFTNQGSTPTEKFKTDICANAPILVDCSRLYIDVRSYASFANAQSGTSASNPVSGGALNTNGFGYNQPQPGQITVVRAVLDYPLYLGSWSAALQNITRQDGTGGRAIVASTAFRTEPYVIPGS